MKNIVFLVPAIIGATIGGVNADKNGGNVMAGIGKGFVIGMAASYIATEVNWGAVGNWVGNLFQQNPVWFLEFVGDAYSYLEDGKVNQYGIGILVLKNKKTKEKIDSYDAVSGPGSNGLLPNSDTQEKDGYQYTKPQLTPKDAFMRKRYESNDGFSFKMKMNTKDFKLPVGDRDNLHIHPTNRFNKLLLNKFDPTARPLTGVTDGCIGLCGSADEAHRFYDKMIEYFNKGNKTIRVIVSINGNKNVNNKPKKK